MISDDNLETFTQSIVSTVSHYVIFDNSHWDRKLILTSIIRIVSTIVPALHNLSSWNYHPIFYKKM